MYYSESSRATEVQTEERDYLCVLCFYVYRYIRSLESHTGHSPANPTISAGEWVFQNSISYLFPEAEYFTCLSVCTGILNLEALSSVMEWNGLAAEVGRGRANSSFLHVLCVGFQGKRLPTLGLGQECVFPAGILVKGVCVPPSKIWIRIRSSHCRLSSIPS